MSKNTLFYILVTGISLLLVWQILHYGELLEYGKMKSVTTLSPEIKSDNAPAGAIFKEISQNFHHPLPVLILQILSIIVMARLFGWVMNKIRQPTVIGEIIAGIILGPSLLGLFFPQVSGFLFPKDSLGNLQFLSQIGLILFMFIVGLELDLSVLQKRAGKAIVISHASIVFPYLLGVALSYFLYREYAPDHIPFIAFALFMGIAMSITAFPVLARIVQERDMSKTAIGAMVITCAAADDVTAWCLLAIVIAIVKAGALGGALATIILSLVYVLFMMYIVRPIFNKVANFYFTRETINRPVVAGIFAMLFFSAYLTEVIGIHALFGAFMAGVIIPNNRQFRHVLAEKIEDLSLILLLPLFFVFTGLRTQIGLLNEPRQWEICFFVILVAVSGKFLGSALASRFVGESWKDSLTIGALMNTRGLMELVVLNIGYDLGVLSDQIFTMLVIMALATTFMTGPALGLVDYIYGRKKTLEPLLPDLPEFNVLISFGPPKFGARLLKLAAMFGANSQARLQITAIHLTPNADISMSEAEVFEREGFAPVLEASEHIGLTLHTIYKPTNEVSREIVRTANSGNYDLMLVGSSRSLFSNDETGGRVRSFLEDVRCSVGVLLDRGFEDIRNMLLLIDDEADVFLTRYAAHLLHDHNCKLSVYDPIARIRRHAEALNDLQPAEQSGQVSMIGSLPAAGLRFEYDLLIVSLESWHKLRDSLEDQLQEGPSVLIINK